MINKDGSCEVESAPMVIDVREDPTVGISADNADVCVGGDVTLTAVPSGGTDDLMLSWESSPTGTGDWTQVSFGSINTYSVNTDSVRTVFFRAQTIDANSGCNSAYSDTVRVDIYNDLEVTMSFNDAEFCIGGAKPRRQTSTLDTIYTY